MDTEFAIGISSPLIWYPPRKTPVIVEASGGLTLGPGYYEGESRPFSVPKGSFALIAPTDLAIRLGRWEIDDVVIHGPFDGAISFTFYPKVEYLGSSSAIFVVRLVKE